jgi:Zn-dependent protease with chaperone function
MIPFLLHGTTLALACFLAINLLLCAFVVMIVRREPRTSSPAFWFGLRVLPAIAAAAFVSIVFVPSYWLYEPRDFAEGFDASLTALAIAALVMVGAGAARGGAAWRRAKRRSRVWMRTACLIDLGTDRVPAFAIEAPAPIMALVGVWRPRLLVTRGLIDALTEEELTAGIAHELGHFRAWDNLKRLLMSAAPDLLAPTSMARFIERQWARAAEHAADRLCGAETPAFRCALASALVKVARLTPPEPALADPISTLVGGGDIALRVHILLDDRAGPAVCRRRRLPLLTAAFAFAALVAAYGPLLRTVHEVTELLVHALP